MNIELTKILKKDLNNGYIKTIDVITLLINKGFKTSLELNKTSLLDLKYNNKQVKKAYFQNNQLIIKF